MNERVNKIQSETGWLSWVILLGMAALIMGRLTDTKADPDLWGYLAFGRLFWIGNGFPFYDIFAYTPTKAIWVYHEWLTGVIFYPLYQNLGPAGLQGLKYILGLGTAVLIYMTARMRGASNGAALICLLLISPFFSFAYSPVRAQIFTNLFFVLTIFILESSRSTGRWRHLWWLAPIFLVWANLHAGFVAGIGLVGLYAAGEAVSKRRFMPYFLISAPSIFVTLINPYGFKYWIYLMQALSMPRPEIDEWQSVFLALKNGEYLANNAFFLLLFFFAVIMVLSLRNWNITDILLLTVTSCLACMHIRHQSLFFLIMGIIAPTYFTQAWENIQSSSVRAARWNRFIRLCTPILFSGLLVIFGARFITGHPFDINVPSISKGGTTDYNYPAGAVEYIRSHGIKGNILTEFSWGEYIIWELSDGCRVAMDGRYETVYPEYVSREFFEFSAGRSGWKNYLHKYPHDMILIRPDSPVMALLRSEPEWREVYTDADGVLFVREKNLTLSKPE
ncbi:MAG: hypothetical protein WCH07_09730 [Deltaproteobacteria bacterium]